MDVTAALDAPFSPEAVFEIISDLDNYPEWLSILPGVERLGAQTWQVELKGKIGPLARSKRLRMVRTDHEPPLRVRFEREELDGRHHSPWILEAEITALSDRASSCELTMRLHYGGSFGDQLIKRMLIGEIEASKPRLLDLLAS